MKSRSLMVMVIVGVMFIGQVFVSESFGRMGQGGMGMGGGYQQGTAGQMGNGGYGTMMDADDVEQMGNVAHHAALLNLSAEDQAKVTAEQTAFLAGVQPLIDQVQQKTLALRTELQKTAPDTQIAFVLQKEISDIQAQIDQKSLQHQINLSKINSALGSNFMGGGLGGGVGRGVHQNCPYTTL